MPTFEPWKSVGAVPPTRRALALGKCLALATFPAPRAAMSFPVLNDARETFRPAAARSCGPEIVRSGSVLCN